MRNVILALWLTLFATPAAAREPAPALTAADLEAFLDGLIPAAIDRADIAGTVVAVVKDGKPLLMKGYGYADVENKVPVSPATTLFRPGSISKLFTWTAVMQQVEAGKLDLDRDVNEYLDFAVPPAFGKPITLRDIMTHRPGFEETVKDMAAGSADRLLPLAEYLPAHIPARIFPPGTVPAYSNYGSTLAGYIVQRVSGRPFEDYIRENILDPLRMRYATFRQPLPEDLAPFMSKGYLLASGGPKPFENIAVSPAGALSASAEAMAHFMIAHLHGGRYEGARILGPAVTETMHTRQEGWPEPMNAMALGFYEQSRNGHRILAHGGDTDLFHSDLFLIPDADVGFFVSCNSLGRPHMGLRRLVFDGFMDRYFPRDTPPNPVLSTAAEDGKALAGYYKVSRRFETNILAVSTLLGEFKLVYDGADSTVYSKAIKNPNGQPRHFREVGPMLFQAVDGQEKLYLHADTHGSRTVYGDYPFLVLQPVRGIESQGFWYLVLGLGLGTVVLTLLGWPVAAVVRKHHGRPLDLAPGTLRLRRLARLACIVVVAFCAGIAVAFSRLESMDGLGRLGDLLLHAIQVVGVLCGAGALLAVGHSLRTWFDRGQWFWTKVWYSLLALGCAGFFWFLVSWHLLNFDLNY